LQQNENTNQQLQPQQEPAKEAMNQWPEELDALIAAPQHHKLLLENELVRVLDTNIPPGETTNLHSHQFPSALYFLRWSHFIRYDSEGNVLLDSRTLSKIPVVGSALWSAPLNAHCLKNIGDSNLHVICVEIKKPTSNDQH
jgi:hypothetical protein